jgi:autoinducer 2-degrading protein
LIPQAETLICSGWKGPDSSNIFKQLPEMKIKPIYVFAKWRVKSGQFENVLDILTKVAMKSTMEEGNLFYRASRCNKDHNTIIVFEAYRDQEAQNKHQSTEHVRNLILGQIVPLLEEREVTLTTQL